MRLPPFPFTVLDTETTGFVPHKNGIIEFACVRCEGGKVVDEYEQLIRVDRAIPDVVSVLTRIKDQDLEGKPMMDDVRDEIVSHIGSDTMIVCQNTPFDLKMLKGDGIDLTDRPWIDTAMLASLVYPELRSFSLGYISKTLNLNHDPVHRALGDVHATLELLSLCWERLCNLPPGMLSSAKDIMSRAPQGYATLFDAIEKSEGTVPPWESASSNSSNSSTSSNSLSVSPLPIPKTGTVDCCDEPLTPGLLQGVIDACSKDDSSMHWIAVKNLSSALRNLEIPDTVSVLHPPFLVADPDLSQSLLAQKDFTNDEATLATKIAWFDPEVEKDIRVHGEERPVWNGKIACTELSDAYLEQFKKLGNTVLLDHRQLLSFLADPKHSGQNALRSGNHIIIDDASMLEDTATKACGSLCQISTLRAIAEGNGDLTKFTDLLSLWAERTRQMRDAYELTSQDLGSTETKGLLDNIQRLLEDRDALPYQAVRLIENVEKILDVKRLRENISWIETRQDGSIFLQSYPRSIGLFLRSELFETFATTLLTPPNGAETLTEVLHPQVSRQSSAVSCQLSAKPGVDVSFPEYGLEKLLENPPEGRTVVLLGSKRLIEQLFIRRTEELEGKGVTLICQSMSGGMERMQAEFLSSDTPVIWALTPWSFEGVFLPPESIDRLVLCSLPFDHPNHIIFSKRAEKYQNAFMDYSLPRLLHRLFRILRTFVRCSTEVRTVEVLDSRIREKKYGQVVKDYLSALSITSPSPQGEGQPAYRQGRGGGSKPQQEALF